MATWLSFECLPCLPMYLKIDIDSIPWALLVHIAPLHQLRHSPSIGQEGATIPVRGVCAGEGRLGKFFHSDQYTTSGWPTDPWDLQAYEPRSHLSIHFKKYIYIYIHIYSRYVFPIYYIYIHMFQDFRSTVFSPPHDQKANIC